MNCFSDCKNNNVLTPSKLPENSRPAESEIKLTMKKRDNLEK